MGYSPEVHEKARTILERRRIASEQALEKRRELLFLRSPRAMEIEQILARTSVAAARAVIGGADVKSELNRLKEQNLSLQKELGQIISRFGFPENYLEQWYECSKCSDSGYIDGIMCDCMKRLLRELAYEELNSISPLSLSDFESFDTDFYSKTPESDSKKSPYAHMTSVLGFCKKYADNFSEASASLLFQGSPGLGKTHLSLAIAKSAIDKGYGVIYVSAPAILRQIENEHFDPQNREKNSEKMITECDLLIIDDLGTEFLSRFTISTIYNILNSRMITSKPTIISTNLTLSELQESYNSRMVSRIIGGFSRVEFVGTDVRQLKRRMKKQSSAQ